MRRLLLLAFILHAVPSAAFSQNPDPVLQPLAFLTGRWTSDAAEEQEEEYWSQAMDTSMVGTFRVLKNRVAVFYEFWVIEVENGKAVFELKHFNRGLLGWEDKADAVRLNLSVSAGQDVLFSKPDGSLSLRYQRNGDELVCTLRRFKDGKVKVDTFHLHRSGG